MTFLKGLLNRKTKKVRAFRSQDAIIIDVRSKSEFTSGAIKDSINIPLPELKSRINSIKNFNAPVITCCAVGVRAAKAASILRQHNIEVINGGGWKRLKKRLLL